MKIETGEIITLDNNKEYICFSTLNHEGKDYVYLMSNFKPIEIMFAIEKYDSKIEIIGDPELKEKVLNLFKQKAVND